MNSESKDDVFSALDRMDALLDRDCDYLKISYSSMTVKRRLADMKMIREAMGRVGWSLPKQSMLSEEMHSTFAAVESSKPGSQAAQETMEALLRRVALLERAHERNKAAEQFMQELTESVETISGIAEEHGSQTIADLMWLYSAILTDGFIDVWPAYSRVRMVIAQLPSSERWNSYLRDQD